MKKLAAALVAALGLVAVSCSSHAGQATPAPRSSTPTSTPPAPRQSRATSPSTPTATPIAHVSRDVLTSGEFYLTSDRDDKVRVVYRISARMTTHLSTIDSGTPGTTDFSLYDDSNDGTFLALKNESTGTVPDTPEVEIGLEYRPGSFVCDTHAEHWPILRVSRKEGSSSADATGCVLPLIVGIPTATIGSENPETSVVTGNVTAVRYDQVDKWGKDLVDEATGIYAAVVNGSHSYRPVKGDHCQLWSEATVFEEYIPLSGSPDLC